MEVLRRSVQRLKPRPPSAPHPDDVRAEREARALSPFTLVDEAPPRVKDEDDKDKKKGIVNKVGGKVSKQIRKKHACERACMCALAVSLLWLTSLGMAKALVTYFIPTPKLDTVVDQGYALYDKAVDMRASYETCAKNNSQACNATYYSDLSLELRAVQTAQDLIDVELSIGRSEMEECVAAYSEALDILRSLSGPALDSVTFSSLDFNGVACDDVVASLLSTQQQTQSVVDESEAFKRQADEQVNTLSNRLTARAAYDAEFLDNITGGLLSEVGDSLSLNLTNADALMDALNVSLSGVLACLSETDEYNGQLCDEKSVFGRARQMYDTSVEEYNRLRNNADEYYRLAVEKLTRYKNLYDQVARALGIINAATPGGIGIILGAIPALPMYFLDALEATFDITDPAEIYRELEAGALQTLNEFGINGELLNKSNLLFTDQAAFIQQTAFADYDPPPVDVNETNEEYNKESDSFVGRMSTKLNAVSSEEDGSGTNELLDDASKINLTEAKTSLLNKADPREWDTFKYEDEVFERLNTGLVRLGDWALILDYTYRILKSLMLIRKYWNISALNTPPADVRTKAGINAGLFKSKRNPVQVLASMVTHPVFNLVLVILFISLLSSSFYYAYEPIYTEYTQGCVERCYIDVANSIVDVNGVPAYNPDSNGTMLYRNLFAVAQQYAFVDGDYVASTQIETLNVERDATCREEVVSSFEKALQQDDLWRFVQTRQLTAVDRIEAMRTCVNLPSLNNSIPVGVNSTVRGSMEAASGLCLGGFPQPAAVVATAEREGKILHRVFDCQNVAPCTFQCAGPNEAELRGTTHESSCTMEWYGHSTSLGFIMTTAVFFLMNMSRYYFMRGIVKVYWRHLVTNRFSYLGSCTERGQWIPPEDVTEKGKSFRKVIVHQLRIALRAFERDGYIITALSIFFNVPWIVTLVILQRGLQFDSNKLCD